MAMVSFSQSEEVVERLMRLPYVNACTDGLLAAGPTPAPSAPTRAILGRFVREKEPAAAEAAVRKLVRPGRGHLRLRGPRLLERGKRANVVLFDPGHGETATFENPIRFPEGMPFVMVGGKLVVRDGQPTGDRPGQVARWARANKR